MKRLRVIDLEGTALDDTAEVIEFAYVDLDRDTGEILTGDSQLFSTQTNPPRSRAIHHIWPEDVVGKPMFDPAPIIASAVADGVVGMVAHNTDYEYRFLGEQAKTAGIHMVCTYKAGLRTWPDAPAHGNFALLYHLMDLGLVSPLRAHLSPSHRAFPDAYATAHIAKALFDAGVTGEQMVQWTAEPRLLPRCPIGQYRDQPWAACDYGFLMWIMRKSDMDHDIQWNAERELTRREEEQS